MTNYIFDCFDELPHIAIFDVREYFVECWVYASADDLQAGADPMIAGYVRFDGCSDWSMSSSHCCDRPQVADLGNLLLQCHDLAAKHCPAWVGY